MNKRLLSAVAVSLSILVALPAMAQRGPGWMDGSGPGQGAAMGRGMMGYQVAPEVPTSLPVPTSQEWTQKLKDVLALERLSYAQYTADAERHNAHMPYGMVIGQEQDHIRTIERLFSAYDLPATSNQIPITETKTLTEALELCVKMDQDLIQRYEWLVQNAGDRQSTAILNELLLQSRQHMVMFQQTLRMDGRMGPGMMGHRY